MKPIFAVGDPHTATRLLAGHSILVSHAYLGDKPTADVPNPKRKPDEWIPWANLIALLAVASEAWCDSGAFTYWQRALKGKPGLAVTVETWAAFIVENFHFFAFFVALDVIGDARATLRNWVRLLELVPPEMHGKLVPVWHEGDPAEHLDAYDPGARIVGLGRTDGRQGGAKGRALTFAFYDAAFNAYPDGAYHLLGNCNPETIEPYPARSFDATTWQRDSAYARSHGWPWGRVSKETRMRAYIEAICGIEHRPAEKPAQTDLLEYIKARSAVTE